MIPDMVKGIQAYTGDVMVSYAVCAAIETAAFHWNDEDTKKYGMQVRDKVFQLASEMHKERLRK